uniref:ORF99 n=1 Tax=Cydia pomonella granulosis virus TaxID=28289 RepID=A0A097P172_GVCP|nr:ORF99 [Cydia pomonella granulovirus]
MCKKLNQKVRYTLGERSHTTNHIMKKYYYFQDRFPVTILYAGLNDYYFKLKELTSCFYLCYNRIRVSTTDKFISPFKRLRSTDYRLHPNTLMLHINGLNGFLERFCSRCQRHSFLAFLRECFRDDNRYLDRRFRFVVAVDYDYDEDIYQHESVDSVCGVLPSNIEFFSVNERTYFKGLDVARHLKCSPSYTINKYVADTDMVLWGDLRRYVHDKYVWTNCKNHWKDNTIFLKETGAKQLCIATQGDDKLYQEMMDGVYNYDSGDEQVVYAKTPSRYKQKRLTAKGCAVGRLKNTGIEYITTPNHVYFKLRQVVKQFSLRINDYVHYKQYLVEWDVLRRTLEGCNIGWKKSLMLVSGEGVHAMLSDVGLKVEADDFAYNKVYEAREVWDKERREK